MSGTARYLRSTAASVQDPFGQGVLCGAAMEIDTYRELLKEVLTTSVEHDGGHYETRQVAKSLLGKIKRELERAKR